MPELVQRIEIDAPIESVWREVTKLGLQRAMLDSVLATTLEPGAPLRYTSRDGRRTFVVGRVVSVEPPTLFSHTYVLTTGDDPPTLVTWSLEEVEANRVRVTVRHTGWPEATVAKRLRRTDSTWAGILEQLKRVVETGDVSAGTKAQYLLMRAFLWAMPARTRTENVEVPDGPTDDAARR